MAKEMSTKNKWRDEGTGERNERTKGEKEMSGAVGNVQKHRHQNIKYNVTHSCLFLCTEVTCKTL